MDEQRTADDASEESGADGTDAERTDVEALQERLAALRTESAQRMAAWQRAQADYENLKKRSQQELAERATLAAAALLMGLLPVVDDFERALAADRAQDPAAWADGVQLIQHKLFQYLEQAGVQPIAAEGQPFDPKFHEAIGKMSGPEGQVVTQVLKGYLLGQRVLRPSQVIVGQGEADGATPPGTDNDIEPAE